MKIGITFNLKSSAPRGANVPDDVEEEFDSPQTIDAIANVLRGMGHSVVLLGEGREFLEKVLADQPDLVFNFAEGQGISRSREARVPAVLDMLGIPYTGSDPFTLAVALDKDCAKKLVALAGVAVPKSLTLEPDQPISSLPIDTLKFPVLVKLAWEGSSKGVRGKCLVSDANGIPAVVAALRRDHPQPILLEEFIAGDELTAGVYGNRDLSVLGILRVVPKVQSDRFIYSLDVKRDYHRHVTFDCPPSMPAAALERVASAAKLAFRALGCRDIARVDFRVRAGVPYFLEVNPLPGLHPVDSDLVIIARMMGWSYEKLVATIVHEAQKRCGMTIG